MKKNKRNRSKYPALNKKLNLKSRQDYIEPEYIKGVRDKNGNLVIRPLNEDELAFLDKFYKETIIADFRHDENEQNFYSDQEQQRAIYRENNARNRCLHNKKSVMGLLRTIPTQKELEKMNYKTYVDLNGVDFDSYMVNSMDLHAQEEAKRKKKEHAKKIKEIREFKKKIKEMKKSKKVN